MVCNTLTSSLKKSTWKSWSSFRKTISTLDDMDPNKFIAKMGADACLDLLVALTSTGSVHIKLRHQAETETSSAT
jgi:hypothetical protein